MHIENGVLSIVSLNLSDAGMYQCVAENKHGIIYASAELMVLGKIALCYFFFQPFLFFIFYLFFFLAYHHDYLVHCEGLLEVLELSKLLLRRPGKKQEPR